MLLAVTSRNTNSISSGNNKMRDENYQYSWWVRMICNWQHFTFLSSFMQMFVTNDFRGLNKHHWYVLNPSLFQPQMLIFPTSQLLADEANFRFSAAFNTTPPSDRGFPYISDLWQRNFFSRHSWTNFVRQMSWRQDSTITKEENTWTRTMKMSWKWH